MLADVGITPDYVVLSPIAVYNALAYDLDFNEKTPGTIIVDIGTTSTDLVIATPGRMCVRSVSAGRAPVHRGIHQPVPVVPQGREA